ncbi:hypothetical protein [Cryobacterium sp. TMS1-13-1]|uniref:hypothetical protein n=1 Tax=Cryobacterium sp. TMS1-13-1 TaxID=1259220 RepID=UPI001F54399E|nr:hypothetical protein [Cryobacterium sp. TMS1-13-1]
MQQTADGIMHWTSPAGKHYATHPTTRLGPNSAAAASERGPAENTTKRPVDIWADLTVPNHDRASTPSTPTPF